MKFGWDDTCLAHDPGPRHPERPERLRAIREGLAQRHGVTFHSADPVTRTAMERVHDPNYIDDIQRFCADGGGNWDADTVATDETWAAARHSAGLSRWAAERALEGDGGRNTPFALGRPPGHHATRDDAMGFCFLNNVGLAATDAIQRGAGRVAILDWDVHHGNGTQEIFLDRGDVCYISVHEEGLYPGTGTLEETGKGSGEGATVNLPLPPGSDDVDYERAMDAVVGPIVDRFDPDLLLVSTGFDAHQHDPISRMHLSTEGYGRLTAAVRSAATATDAALAFVLEGGYSLDTLAEGVGMVHEVFDGYEPVAPSGDPDQAVEDRIASARKLHGLG